MQEATKRAVIYARTATVQENVPNFALAEQIHQCKEYATQKGYSVVAVFQEVGSGNALDRQALQLLLQAGKAGTFDAVIIRSFDRLSRKSDVALLVIATLADYGVKCISVTEPLPSEMNASLNWLFAFLHEGAARRAKASIAQRRARAGRQAKRANATNHRQAKTVQRIGTDLQQQ